MRERYATVASYVQPMLKAARPAQPVSVALFGGRLEYGRLPWWAVLFVMLVIQAPAGDPRLGRGTTGGFCHAMTVGANGRYPVCVQDLPARFPQAWQYVPESW